MNFRIVVKKIRHDIGYFLEEEKLYCLDCNLECETVAQPTTGGIFWGLCDNCKQEFRSGVKHERVKL